MNHAYHYAWNRNQRQGRRTIPKPTRLGWTIFICATILIASARLAIPQTRTASSLLSFQEPGNFSKRDSENLECAALILQDLHPDIKTIKRNVETDLRIRKGEIPGVMK